MVCGAYSEVLVNSASRIGYVAITFLPALGIHLANEISGRKMNWTTIVAYLLAALLFTLGLHQLQLIAQYVRVIM